MMKNLFERVVTISILSIAVLLPGAAQSITGKDLYAWVQGIEGKDPAGRRDFVKKELTKMGVAFTAVPFKRELKFQKTSISIEGENIIVSLGKGSRNIVVGAHLDAVPNSPGANDNGGSVAVLLGIVQSMKNFAWNHKIDFCFFDQEEMGLVGSQEFVKTYADSSIHLAMINLDVNGMGDMVFVGPVGGGDDDLLLPMARGAAARERLPFREHEFYPPSDHLSFGIRKLENISVSVVPYADVDLLVEAVLNGWQIDPDKVPEVMKYMHTPEDKSEHVSPKALEISFRFTSALLDNLNAMTSIE
ncbi:MAG: M28 family peptidase [Bacteroidota bacterium]